MRSSGSPGPLPTNDTKPTGAEGVGTAGFSGAALAVRALLVAAAVFLAVVLVAVLLTVLVTAFLLFWSRGAVRRAPVVALVLFFGVVTTPSPR